MDIKGMVFQTDNSGGGRISKIERAMLNLCLASNSRVDIFYLYDAPKTARVSVVSLYRYWQHFHNNSLVYHANNRTLRAELVLGVRAFVVEVSDED
jgi:hypothetical protein